MIFVEIQDADGTSRSSTLPTINAPPLAAEALAESAAYLRDLVERQAYVPAGDLPGVAGRVALFQNRARAQGQAQHGRAPYVTSGGAFGDAGSAGGQTVEERLKAIGGAALVTKAIAVRRQYGDQITNCFIKHATTDPAMTSAYTARDQTARMATVAPSSSALGAVKSAVARVSAAEAVLITQCVKAVKSGQKSRPITPRGVGQRDVEGNSGWRYRQYADGTIVILVDPRDGGPATGAVLREGSAWDAITAEIGSFPQEQIEPLPRSLPAQSIPASARRVPSSAARNMQTTLTAGALTVATTAATGGTVVGAGTVSGLLAAAGVSATVPVAGWLVAGGLGLGAATVALVRALRRGKMSKAKIIALARKHKIPDADDFPAFTVKAFRLKPERQQEIGVKLSRAIPRLKGEKRKRAEGKLRILAAVALHGRAEGRAAKVKGRARLGEAGSGTVRPFALGDHGAPSIAREDVDLGSLILAGFGEPHTPPSTLGAGNLVGTDLTPAVQKRILVAFSGVISGTGAVDPREAAAFVAGYLEKKYIPGRKAKGALTDAQAVRLSLLVAQFGGAAAQATADRAYEIVLSIGKESSVLAEIRSKLGGVFGKIRALVGGPSAAQQQAIAVLQHAAAIIGGMGEVRAARAFALAAGVEDRDTDGIASAITNAAESIVETVSSAPKAIIQQSREVAEQAEKTIAAGVNTVAKVAEQTKELADQKLEAVKRAAEGLASAGEQALKETAQRMGQSVADITSSAKSTMAEAGQSIVGVARAAQNTALNAGQTATEAITAARAAVEKVAATAATEVKDKLAEVTKLASTTASTVGEVRDAAKKELAEAADNFKLTLSAAKASTDNAVRALATSVETKLQDALQAAQSARDSVAKVPALVQTALKSELDDLRALGARMRQDVQQLVADPCSSAALRSAGACQRFEASGSRCDLLPVAAARAACKASSAVGGVGRLALIVGGLAALVLLFLVLRPRFATRTGHDLSALMD